MDDEITTQLAGLSVEHQPRSRSSSVSSGSSSASSRSSSRRRKPIEDQDYVPQGSSIAIRHFAKSCSEFGLFEQGALRIRHQHYDTAEQAFPEFGFYDISAYTPSMVAASLPGIDCNNILLPVAASLCTTNAQHSLRRKFGEVFINNYITFLTKEGQRDEGAVDDFVRQLLVLMGFDDEPKDLRAKPLLELQIGAKLFAAINDFAVRRKRRIFLVIVENKHVGTDTFLHGKLQLVCGMIAAAELQMPFEGDSIVIYGILVMGDQFAFARAEITSAYVSDLKRGKTPDPLNVSWFPKEYKDTYYQQELHTMVGLPYGIEAKRHAILSVLAYMAYAITK